MLHPPAVVVHGLADIRTALQPGLSVTLLSAPGAALYAGAGWWRALMATAEAEAPGRELIDILDCADAAGRALEALRAGQSLLVLLACPGRTDIATIACSLGAHLLAARPPALDLAEPGAARRLAGWLAGPAQGDSSPGFG
jgi:hypothetical protein